MAAGISASQDPQPAPTPQAAFDAMLARVKKSDPSVDFLQLRRLYADSEAYRPYRDDAEGPMVKAASTGDHETALRIARGILERDYMNIEAHFAATLSCAATKDEACEAQHKYVAGGLIASILASGDGKTPATAFVVVKTPEEYALLRVLLKRRLSQTLIHQGGHSYDLLTVQDQQTGQESSLYFNVDASLAATARVFGLKVK